MSNNDSEPRRPKVVAPRTFELSSQTLNVCHQAIAAIPASNAQQARVLANTLAELEAAIQQKQPPVAEPVKEEAAAE
jgi:hypothetical protein